MSLSSKVGTYTFSFLVVTTLFFASIGGFNSLLVDNPDNALSESDIINELNDMLFGLPDKIWAFMERFTFTLFGVEIGYIFPFMLIGLFILSFIVAFPFLVYEVWKE